MSVRNISKKYNRLSLCPNKAHRHSAWVIMYKSYQSNMTMTLQSHNKSRVKTTCCADDTKLTHFLTASSCSWLYFGWISWQSEDREPRRDDAGELGAELRSAVSVPSSAAAVLLSAVASWFNRSANTQTRLLSMVTITISITGNFFYVAILLCYRHLAFGLSPFPKCIIIMCLRCHLFFRYLLPIE